MFVNNFVNRLTEFIQPLEIVYITKILNGASQKSISIKSNVCCLNIKAVKYFLVGNINVQTHLHYL